MCFDSAEKAEALASALKYTVPYDTGKHVYSRWTPILQKRGAYHPLMDPFKMEANRDIVPDYSEDMCPKTLEYLKKAVYVNVKPDATKEQMDEVIAAIRNQLV